MSVMSVASIAERLACPVEAVQASVSNLRAVWGDEQVLASRPDGAPDELRIKSLAAHAVAWDLIEGATA